MGGSPWYNFFRFRNLTRSSLVGLAFLTLFGIRLSKGSIFLDTYAFLSRPFWPGSAQSEWIIKGVQFEQEARLKLLEEDNLRLRKLLSIQESSGKDYIAAAVISRKESGWWQQILLNKGAFEGIGPGNLVTGPGGLVGIVQSVTPTTSLVRLTTAPGSRIGVWISRTKTHAILLGIGTNRPLLRFLDKNPDVKSGDFVSTSPASTLTPPNIPVGVIQSINTESLNAATGLLQLTAAPQAIDWVQVKTK